MFLAQNCFLVLSGSEEISYTAGDVDTAWSLVELLSSAGFLSFLSREGASVWRRASPAASPANTDLTAWSIFISVCVVNRLVHVLAKSALWLCS